MEAIKHLIKTPRNHEITIKIPDYVLEDEEVEIILFVQKEKQTYLDKIQIMKNAMSDLGFKADLEKVQADFLAVDFENWDEDE